MPLLAVVAHGPASEERQANRPVALSSRPIASLLPPQAGESEP